MKRCARRSKNELKPWLKRGWCIPPKKNARFAAQMEEVLDVYQRPVYQRPYDPKRPQVCLDEACKQLLGHKTQPLVVQPARGDKPGHGQRVDYEYERHGVANLFMLFEPLAGRRHVAVRERRTGVDWAHMVKALVDQQYAEAEVMVLVMDNLNPHGVWSLYEAFAPTEAKRLADKLEIHYMSSPTRL
jgi:DDE superfamily endonuclease